MKFINNLTVGFQKLIGVYIAPEDSRDKDLIHRIKGKKTLFSILILGIAVYVGFTPLFSLTSDVAKSVIGSAFGTIFVVIITMYLLNKQTEVEQESKKGEVLFQKKLELYSEILKDLKKCLEDEKISQSEVHQSIFSSIELQMIASENTINSYNIVFEEIKNQYDADPEDGDTPIDSRIQGQIMSALLEFANSCRSDLGVGDGHQDEKDALDNVREAIKKATDPSFVQVQEDEVDDDGERMQLDPKISWKINNEPKTNSNFVISVVKLYVEQAKIVNKNITSKEIFGEIHEGNISRNGPIFPHFICDPEMFKLNRKKSIKDRRKVCFAVKLNEAIEINKNLTLKSKKPLYATDEDLIIHLKDGKFALWNRWNDSNLPDFLNEFYKSIKRDKDEIAKEIEKNITSPKGYKFLEPIISYPFQNKKRDYSKVKYKSISLGKRPFTRTVLLDYVKNNPGISSKELEKIFPHHLAGNKEPILFAPKDDVLDLEIKGDRLWHRYYGVSWSKEEEKPVLEDIHKDKWLHLSDGIFLIWQMWGTWNFPEFLEHV